MSASLRLPRASAHTVDRVELLARLWIEVLLEQVDAVVRDVGDELNLLRRAQGHDHICREISTWPGRGRVDEAVVVGRVVRKAQVEPSEEHGAQDKAPHDGQSEGFWTGQARVSKSGVTRTSKALATSI